jgi:hypothetical protein
MTPRVWVFAHCRNERALAPYFVRHYSLFAERIIIFDDKSTDGTPEYLSKQPKVTVHPLEDDCLDEDKLLRLAYDVLPRAAGHADWCIWADMDEFVHHENMLEALQRHEEHDAIMTLGFNMMGAPLPQDDGFSQLTDIYNTGVRAPVYSKPIIVRPDCLIRWSRGKHTIDNNSVRMSPWPSEQIADPWTIKLLHYRYLTPEYTRLRNARQFERSISKNAAWSNSPEHKGEHSPEWCAATMKYARDVVDPKACYLEPGVTDA